VDGLNDDEALADAGGNALRRAGADVANGKDALARYSGSGADITANLLRANSEAGEHETLPVEFEAVLEPTGVGSGASRRASTLREHPK